jgi:hypothetical protein
MATDLHLAIKEHLRLAMVAARDTRLRAAMANLGSAGRQSSRCRLEAMVVRRVMVPRLGIRVGQVRVRAMCPDMAKAVMTRAMVRVTHPLRDTAKVPDQGTVKDMGLGTVLITDPAMALVKKVAAVAV